eukprot:TRINITY_DN4718_c0_g1_i2.p1 TRINITY_DN4718_c0_g1~~TRINITY_DN4718_c0_g1_i2.p1  ORF type:complete len:262 (+),score=45.97 TRINITY_DN4718_c0_g1_i2:115-900(+)
MRVSDKCIQRRVALALAHLCSVSDQRMIFIDNNGLDILLGLLDPSTTLKHQHYSAVALHTLAKRATADCPIDAALPPPTPQVYLGEKYVNSNILSDVTFLVEGRRFYAHRIALLASSDAFRAMFDGGYREKDASDIEIPNISWEVFELMMRYIYTGTVDIPAGLAQDLLMAADQYLLESLKRLCETCIGKDLTVENLGSTFDLVESYHASTLGHVCALYFLEHHDQISNMPGYPALVQRILPEIHDYLTRILRPQAPFPSQ